VDTYPAITFKSIRQVRGGKPNLFDVTGTLTMHGITNEIVLPVTYLGTAKDPWGKERVGFETEITVNRRHYGLMWNAALETGGFLVGDEVKINLSIQAVAQ
jgi:polyisoprenoid-binding protein YceI